MSGHTQNYGGDPMERLVRVGDLPARITNPEAWPPGYADGFNDYATYVDEAISVVRKKRSARPSREDPPSTKEQFSEKLRMFGVTHGGPMVGQRVGFVGSTAIDELIEAVGALLLICEGSLDPDRVPEMGATRNALSRFDAAQAFRSEASEGDTK